MARSPAEAGTAAVAPVPHCPRCDSVELRRHARIGFLQSIVLPYFGLYPWECAQCRRMFMLRRRTAQRPASGVRQNVFEMETAGKAWSVRTLAEKAVRLPAKRRLG